jgi:abortive infection bacteriophage resistance protein
MKYDKPPLSVDQEVDLLISRGMDIPDRQRAVRYLTHINYYRLRAYWLIFEEPDATGMHRFKLGTRFEDALSLYIFDRKLRMLVLEAIERVEVSFRTRFAYILGNRYGSHAYLDSNLFKSAGIYSQCLESLRDEFNRSRETFIEHYKGKYDTPDLPPIWAVCEIMSFGQLSKWFQNLRQRPDRKDIAAIFQIDESVLGSFMHHLSHIRNLAAHHSRLWNRRLTFTMTIPRQPSKIAGWFNLLADRNIYNTLVMLGYILSLMSPGTTWINRVKQLIDDNPVVNPAFMGFPTSWREISLWRRRS